jgi:hypothetical protein
LKSNRFGKITEANILERVISGRSNHLFSESIIKCKCRAEILVVPDLRAMDRAIEAHVSLHRKNEKYNSKNNATAESVRSNLIAQVFMKTSGQKGNFEAL